MPISFPDNQDSIPLLHSNGHTPQSDPTNFNSQRLGLSGNSSRLQTQTLEGNVARRWSRLQRRSPLDNNQSLHHRSPRTRNLTLSTASAIQHRGRIGRQYQSQHTQRRLDNPSTSPSSYNRSIPLRGQRTVDSVMPSSSLPSSTTNPLLTTPQMSVLGTAVTSSFTSRHDTDQHRNQPHAERAINSSAQMTFHRSTETSQGPAPTNSVVFSSQGADYSGYGPHQPRNNIESTTTTSTPLTWTSIHGSLSSSSISAADSDPSSVSVSVSSSSPLSSGILPALTPSTTSIPPDRRTFGTNTIDSVASGDSNNRSTEQHSPLDSTVAQERGNRGSQNQAESHNISEADDRIHFRLLNNIYFSASARQSGHDSSSMMDSISRDTNQENRLVIRRDRGSNEDGMEYEDRGPRAAMFTEQREEFASIMINTRQSNSDSSEDYDDDDDDDDDVIVNRHIQSSDDMSMDFESPSLPHRIERPQHAPLSPHSAAALTNMFSDGRTSWPQPMLNSSISFDLLDLSEGRTGHEYNNNPYFRRPPPPPPAITPLNGNENILPSERRHRQVSGAEFRNTLGSRSISTQHENNQYDQLYLRGVGAGDNGRCGESLPATSNEPRDDVWPLKFDMYYADGGEFNATHSVENVLKNDTSVYCSRRSTNINICLKLAEPHHTFVLTQFRAKAPTTGFTAPCKEGLIFVSHDPIPLEKTASFDNMTRERYDEYMKNINQESAFKQMLQTHGANADSLVPAGFFQMEGPDETCTLDLTPSRSGRYVLIKLLRSRCTNSLQRPENIDLQYLGLIGFTGARSFASGGLL
ncbi:hypothetical protein BGZ76_010291 [Entomortierella beljakovae]|nr:hypothetical protein BGZ76_010291 [Entomortierella beljakovae]